MIFRGPRGPYGAPRAPKKGCRGSLQTSAPIGNCDIQTNHPNDELSNRVMGKVHIQKGTLKLCVFEERERDLRIKITTQISWNFYISIFFLNFSNHLLFGPNLSWSIYKINCKIIRPSLCQNIPVCLSSDGRCVIISFKGAKLHLHAPIIALVFIRILLEHRRRTGGEGTLSSSRPHTEDLATLTI